MYNAHVNGLLTKEHLLANYSPKGEKYCLENAP